MLFYIVLILVCLIAAIMVLRLFDSIVGSFQRYFKSSNHGHREGFRRNSKKNAPRRINDLEPAKPARTQSENPENLVPGGWPGHTNKVNERHPKTASSNGMDLNAYMNRNRARIQSNRGREQNSDQHARNQKPAAYGNIYSSDRKTPPISRKRKPDDGLWGR